MVNRPRPTREGKFVPHISKLRSLLVQLRLVLNCLIPEARSALKKPSGVLTPPRSHSIRSLRREGPFNSRILERLTDSTILVFRTAVSARTEGVADSEANGYEE